LLVELEAKSKIATEKEEECEKEATICQAKQEEVNGLA